MTRIANLDTVASMTTMNVSLSEGLKAFVDEQVAERHYSSTSEYIRDLIRRDQDRVRLREMLTDGGSSEAAVEVDDGYLDELRARARASQDD